MLTPDKINLLHKPFALDEHGFLEGSPYILKPAIRERLSRVDPHWTNTPPEVLSVVNDVIALRGGLTIAGDTRYSVGTGIIISVKKDKATGEITPLEPYKISLATMKAFKTAQSDLLPRCAMEFGVGAYLKNKPRDVTQGSFERWLAQINAASHWAKNGSGELFNERMKSLNLTWPVVAEELEPGRVLSRLSDTVLTFEQAVDRLNEIVEERR